MSIENIKRMLLDSAEAKTKSAETLTDKIQKCAEISADAIKNNGKLLFCGNGGSAADSQHLATELVVRLTGEFDRPAMKAVALTTDSSILTACANDYGFENVFARQVEAIGNRNDILFALSTSGNSPNIVKAVDTAKSKGLNVIGLLGGDGGELKSMVDYSLIAPSNETARIQECHITFGHIIIAVIEDILFSKK